MWSIRLGSANVLVKTAILGKVGALVADGRLMLPRFLHGNGRKLNHLIQARLTSVSAHTDRFDVPMWRRFGATILVLSWVP